MVGIHKVADLVLGGRWLDRTAAQGLAPRGSEMGVVVVDMGIEQFDSLGMGRTVLVEAYN